MIKLGMTDIIILIVLAVVIIAAVVYLIKAKKNGQACIGCPNSAGCSGHCHCNDDLKSQ